MSSNESPGHSNPIVPERAAPSEPPLSRWQKFRLVVKVVELRLRFIALMAITGLVFAYWDTLWNRYDKWMRPPTTKAVVASNTEFYCPMHPQVVRDEQGSCPICGMPLTKRKKGEKEVLPAGVISRIQLAPFRIQQAGITTAEVAYAPLTETLSTVGFVEFDERRMAHIASKVPGMARVEKLYVNFTGVDVAAGQTLGELYSPELYQAIQELLLARRAAAGPSRPQSSLGRSLLGDPQELTRLAVEKLKLWGITQAQIDEILKQGKADFKIPIIAPVGGHVLKKNVVEGQFVQEGQAMFEIADLHTVWVKARIFEDEVGLVHLGQAVEARVEAFPGQVFPGRVAFVFPHLDPATRTVEIRYDLDNPGHRLRPGMFASVTLKTPVAETPMFAARRPAEPVVRRTGLSAEEQKICPVEGAELGTMGPPIAVEIAGQTLWTCCDACPPKLKANPDKYLAKLIPSAGNAMKSTVPEEQKTCPVTGAKLGSMGAPFAVEVAGRKVLLCCEACAPKLKADPAKYLAKLSLSPAVSAPTPEPSLASTAEEQKICPVTGAPLGSMGAPIPVEVEGRKVWTCCNACPPKLKAEPARYLARLVPPPKDAVLTVPESAVIDTGTDKIVYVEAEPGVFEGRKVVLGPRSGDLFPVLDGLAPGEKVAATGAFLIDAESRINPATRGDAGGASPAAPEKANDHPPAQPKPEAGPPTRSASATTGQLHTQAGG
jgi:Cu(I)/Ag(I) efflux system membrane fusion protein